MDGKTAASKHLLNALLPRLLPTSLQPSSAPGVPAASPWAAAAPAAAAKPEWTEHTAPDGRKYYYNSRTKQSAWVKPDELKTPAERAAEAAAALGRGPAAAAAPAAASPAAAAPAAKPDWTEHTAPDGRKYYYNSRTKQSSWVKPDELKTPAERAAEAAAAAARAAPAAASPAAAPAAARPAVPAAVPTTAAAAGAPAAVRPGSAAGGEPKAAQVVKLSSGGETGPTPVYATTQEAKDAFKQLLTDVGITGSMGWDETMRIIAQDRRYGALKTLGEKKAAFHEYIAQRKREEAEEARQRRMQARAGGRRAKEGFYALLDEHAEQLGSRPKLSRARDLLELDPRWQARGTASLAELLASGNDNCATPTPDTLIHMSMFCLSASAVDSQREREELLEDWIEERERVEKEARKAERKRKAATFRELLEGCSFVAVDTSWRKAADRLAGEEAYEALDKAARLEVYQEYIRELERKEREEKEKEREERKRQERKSREAFRELLAKHRAEGIINAKTRWREYQPVVKDEEAYVAVEQNTGGSRPKELFQDVLEEMEAAYDKEREKAKALVSERSIEVGPEGTWEAFQAALPEAGAPELEGISAPSALAKAEKAKRRAREDFSHMLRSMRSIKADATWEAAQEACAGEPEWKEIEDEEERKELFEEHILKLVAKEAERAERKR
eukprot:scaffold16.g160.t1